MNKLTGHKDTDFLILMQLSDRDLGAVCSVNKYAKKVCEDDAFWKNRLFANLIFVKLEKEYLDAGFESTQFYQVILDIKNFIESSKWKDFYIFIMEHDKISMGYNIREAIVRFSQDDDFHADLDNTPKWINKEEFLKILKREYFLGFGRADGQQGKLRLDRIVNEWGRFLAAVFK